MNAQTTFPKRLGTCLQKVRSWNPAREAPEEELPYIDLGAIDNDRKEITGVQRIFGKAAPSRARQLVQSGDVLVSTVRPYLNGVAQVPDELDGATASTGFCVLRAEPTKADASYLFHWVRSPAFVADMVRQSTGASYPAVSDRIIHNSLAPLPSLPEQKRIAAILDKAEELRRARSRSLARLSRLDQAIFVEMFGDPVTNSKGWQTVKLGDLCEVGSSKRVFVSEFVDEGVPFYRGTEVGILGSGGKVDPDLYISREHYEVLIQQSGRPQIGDLLLPSICHDGRIWRVDHGDPFYFKDGRVLWIKTNGSSMNGDYLRSQLRNILMHNYKAIASGTTFAELKIVNLKNLRVLYPPEDLQAAYAFRTNSVERHLSECRRSMQALESLFVSVQKRAFSGKL